MPAGLLNMPDALYKVLSTHAKVVIDGLSREGGPRYSSYAVSNLRGGVGKTSLTFNLAYELSRRDSVLLVDMCPQANLTEVVMPGEKPKATIIHALLPRVLGPAFGGTRGLAMTVWGIGNDAEPRAVIA